MELKDLKCFVAVYEANGFGRAADAMNTSQSNVSARIKKLEAILGGPLFYRQHRSIAPTAKGERLYSHAKRAIASADDVVSAMREERAA